MKTKGTDTLRTGFSTGACAAAVITAAYQSLVLYHPRNSMRIWFPDDEQRVMNFFNIEPGFAEIAKDAGDDPDCTNCAHIYASLKPITYERPQIEDYTFTLGTAEVIIRAVEGIGLCTRKGLPCEEGKWAINPVPLEMICRNLELRGIGSTGKRWLVELGVRNGEELAKKTLNARLGIVGGISILGTTGLVRPYSHDAYEKSIAIQVNSAKSHGHSRVLFATGSRTCSGAVKYLEPFPEESAILIADFIGPALKSAEKAGMSEAIVACMPGKLLKYIAGYENTHAHKTDQMLKPLEEAIRSLVPERHRDLSDVPTVREALVGFSDSEIEMIMNRLVPTALQQLQRIVDTIEIRILLFGFEGELMTDSKELA